MIASATAAPTSPQRRSHVVESGAGADTEMDVDGETDDGDEGEAEAETDCLTSRAPLRAASLPPRCLAVHAGALETVGRDTEVVEMAMSGTVATPAHLDLAGTCVDPHGAWVYVVMFSSLPTTVHYY